MPKQFTDHEKVGMKLFGYVRDTINNSWFSPDGWFDVPGNFTVDQIMDAMAEWGFMTELKRYYNGAAPLWDAWVETYPPTPGGDWNADGPTALAALEAACAAALESEP